MVSVSLYLIDKNEGRCVIRFFAPGMQLER